MKTKRMTKALAAIGLSLIAATAGMASVNANAATSYGDNYDWTSNTEKIIYTPNGSTVTANFRTLDSTTKNSNQKQSIRKAYEEKINKMKSCYDAIGIQYAFDENCDYIVKTPTPLYNSFSYAFYSGMETNNCWIDNINSYLSDGSYIWVNTNAGEIAKKGDIVVYYESGNPISAGVIQEEGNDYQNLRVISKWGEGPLLRHSLAFYEGLGNCLIYCYDNNYTYADTLKEMNNYRYYIFRHSSVKHTYTYRYETTTTGHIGYCVCGESSSSSSHSYTDKYELSSDNKHKAYCACGESREVEHSGTCSNDGNGKTHTVNCNECGFVGTVNHNYTYNVRDITKLCHTGKCKCGDTYTGKHWVIAGKSSDPRYVYCEACGYRILRTDPVISIIMGKVKKSANGSYILPSGIAVLVEADVEAYLNGTLVFYEEEVSVNSIGDLIR